MAYAVIVGLILSLIRVYLSQNLELVIPNLQLTGLVPVAFLPQFFAFYAPMFTGNASAYWIPYGLVTSQALLLIFMGRNLKQAGFWLLGLGLGLNLLVISLNGGFMPITPEMAAKLFQLPLEEVGQIGQRLGTSKDIILEASDTNLWILSDRFFLSFPNLIPYRVAYSIGDVLIVIGAFWFTWLLGQKKTPQQLAAEG
ncbi:MAG: DUF5317 family protein [Chloroflexota bacterium]